jgi:hypothetical protein
MTALNRSPWTYRLGIPFFHLAAIVGLFAVRPSKDALAAGLFL